MSLRAPTGTLARRRSQACSASPRARALLRSPAEYNDRPSRRGVAPHTQPIDRAHRLSAESRNGPAPYRVQQQCGKGIISITPIIGEAAALGLAVAGSTEALAQQHPGIEASIHRQASAESGRLVEVNRLPPGLRPLVRDRPELGVEVIFARFVRASPAMPSDSLSERAFVGRQLRVRSTHRVGRAVS